ncbi:MAG: prephenate dehydratase [Fibrobacterota bacterium]
MTQKKTILTLGPAQTFSHEASQIFSRECGGGHGFIFGKTITKICRALAKDTADYAVVPIENLSEGFVQETLDCLIDTPLHIIHELTLSVQFSFVANTENLHGLDKVYVQSVAYGQCSHFISNLERGEIVYTDSNIESLHRLLKESRYHAGAIIPCHAVKDGADFPCTIANVNNYEHNKTRFVVLSKKPSAIAPADTHVKTTLLVMDNSDHSGILSAITNALSSRKINMTSIISRPTKEAIGKYHFFIDIEGHGDTQTITDAVSEIHRFFPCRILGIYHWERE